MRYKKGIYQNPWLSICSEEWKRAKSIIHFTVSMPKFFWVINMGSTHGRCFTSGREIWLNDRYQQTNFLGSELEKEFRLTLRHEFAHIHTKHHGPDFRFNLERLEGNRYAGLTLPRTVSIEYMPAVRQKIERPKVDVKVVRRQLALKNLKQAQTRFKRAKTLLKKWENKVKYYELIKS